MMKRILAKGHILLNVVVIISIAIILTSCNKEHSGSIIFQSEFVEKETDLRTMVTDTRYIAIDDTIPLSYLTGFMNIGEDLLISTDEGLIRFGLDGKFINRIGSMGRGPGEYQSIKGFSVDEAGDRIYILAGKAVMIFSSTGEFIRSFIPSESETFSRIRLHKGLIYLFDSFSFGEMKYCMMVTDTLGNILNKRHNFIEPFESSVSVNVDVTFDKSGKIYYWNILNDTIFEINEFEMDPYYLFASDDARITPEDLIDQSTFITTDKPIPSSIIATGDFLILGYNNFKSPLSRLTVVYNTRTNIPVSVNNIERNTKNVGIKHLLEGNINFNPQGKINIDGDEYLLHFENALSLKTKVLSDDFLSSDPVNESRKRELYDFGSQLDENDNPVLILARLK